LPAGRKFGQITQNRPRKKIFGRENLVAVWPPILDKSGSKKYCMKNMNFPMIYWLFYAIVIRVSEFIFQGKTFLCGFSIFHNCKNIFLKKCRFFSHLAEFFSKIYRHPVLGPGISAERSYPNATRVTRGGICV
jgi:hypothetical protein